MALGIAHLAVWYVASPAAGQTRDRSPEQQAALNRSYALQAEVDVLIDQGRFAEAVPLAEQLLAARRDALGGKHAGVAAALNNLGFLLSTLGDFDAAEPYYEQALAMNLAVLGPDHPNTGMSLTNMGYLRAAVGDLEAAQTYYEQGLAVLQKAYGEEHVEVASVLGLMASLHRSLGDSGAARPLYERELAIRRKLLGADHPDVGTSLNNLGLVLQELGDAAAAQDCFNEALAIWQQSYGSEHVDVATALGNLGNVSGDLGDYHAARTYYDQALAMRRKLQGEEHGEIAVLLGNIGQLLIETGDLAAARLFAEQSLAMQRKLLGPDHPDVAAALSNMGHALMSMGDPAGARSHFEQAVEILNRSLGADHPLLATATSNLGVAQQLSGDYSAAEVWILQALAMRRRIWGDEHLDVANSLNNLGTLRQETGRYDAARSDHEQALAIQRKTLGARHVEVAGSLSNLGSVLQSLHEFGAARKCYDEALSIYQELLGDNHPDTALAINNLGTLLRATGDVDGARRRYQQALSTMTRLLDDTAVALSERQQLEQSRQTQWFLFNYLCSLETTPDQSVQAYRAALAWKGSILLRQRASRTAAADPALAPLVADLQSTVRQWTALSRGSSHGDGTASRQRLAELTARKERLEAELASRSVQFRRATADVRLEDLQTALPAGAVLIDYFECWRDDPAAVSGDRATPRKTQRSLVAFVVKRGVPVQMLDLGPAAPIERAIDEWRRGYGETPAAHKAGQRLRRALWEPLTALVGSAQVVLISPDGALGRLPFNALPGRAENSYLIEDHAIALAPVPRLLPSLEAARRTMPPNPPGNDLLLVGGVDYDRRQDPKTAIVAETAPVRLDGGQRSARAASGLVWAPLPGASAEADAIGRLYREFVQRPAGSVMHLNGAAATEDAFRRLAPQYRRLHLATHGFFAAAEEESALAVAAQPPAAAAWGAGSGVPPAGASPGLLSGLVLAGANLPPTPPVDLDQLVSLPEDGILTAEEIGLLPLQDVELVVLSACETGLGQTAGGEGLLGMQRAFQAAGVRTTVATLWKVDDAMTERLMTAFYRRMLAGGQSCLSALRGAQLELLAELRDAASREAAVGDANRGADAPDRASGLGAPYFWAAFTLSGDWR